MQCADEPNVTLDMCHNPILEWLNDCIHRFPQWSCEQWYFLEVLVVCRIGIVVSGDALNIKNRDCGVIEAQGRNIPVMSWMNTHASNK